MSDPSVAHWVDLSPFPTAMVRESMSTDRVCGLGQIGSHRGPFARSRGPFFLRRLPWDSRRRLRAGTVRVLGDPAGRSSRHSGAEEHDGGGSPSSAPAHVCLSRGLPSNISRKKSAALLTQRRDIESRNGSAQPLKREFAGRLGHGHALNNRLHLGVNQDLTVLSLTAKTCR